MAEKQTVRSRQQDEDDPDPIGSNDMGSRHVSPDVCGLAPQEWARLAATTPSIEGVYRWLETNLRQFDFDAISFVFDVQLIPSQSLPARPHRFGVMASHDWEQRLEDEPSLAQNDPIARRFIRSERPLYFWRGSPLARSLRGPEQRYIDLYEEYGMRSGLAMPVHDRRAGTFSVLFLCDSNGLNRVQALSRGEGAKLHLALTHFLEGMRVRHLKERSPTAFLSDRERECLCWVAAGYSTKLIADRLVLADATVNEYIASAMRKLECHSRAQACARATLLSLIEP
jgi:DNA-binding CsgD family transcriptional regulator